MLGNSTPKSNAFVGLLERAGPDMAMLEELMRFDANSDQHVAELRYMFGYEDNALLGLRESNTFVFIEVFYQVGPFAVPCNLSPSILIFRCKFVFRSTSLFYCCLQLRKTRNNSLTCQGGTAPSRLYLCRAG